jgi:putative nucleotidyltransferase with HDIG domain
MSLAGVAGDPRLAELIGSLSLATDAAAGLAMETALRTSLLAVLLGRELQLPGETLSDIYYTGLLRFIGCTAYAHETAQAGAGDDLGLLRLLTPADSASPRDVAGRIVRGAGRDAPLLRRAGSVGRLLSDPALPRRLATAHCEQAVALATRLGMSPAVVEALGQIYERFDGKGLPHKLRGDAISLPARTAHVAWRVVVQSSLESPAHAVEAVRRRAGTELDPQIAAAFLARPSEFLAPVRTDSVWDAFLDAEPAPVKRLRVEEIDGVADAFARYVDLKSPFTLEHSTGVARLAEGAAEAAGLAPEERRSLRVAALLHDLGRTSVPNGIWDKPGPLNAVEWERVRLHAYQSERILARSALLEPYARIAGAHHERADGSGYHRGVGGSSIARPARLLAAADTYQAMTEPRAYRPARAAPEVARLLTQDAREGRLDREAVEAVLTAAGQRAAGRVRGEWPASLSGREVEVLCLVARGLPNKAIAAELTLSARTVQHHVEHIYAKTGVSTRAAAALFAVENDLLQKWAR